MIGAPVELLSSRPGGGESEVRAGILVSLEPHPHGLHYLIRLHRLRSKHLLNSATLSFKTRAFENIEDSNS